MGMIQCPECGKTISDKAERCIHCGAPINVVEPVLIEPVPKIKSKLIKIKVEDSNSKILWEGKYDQTMSLLIKNEEKIKITYLNSYMKTSSTITMVILCCLLAPMIIGLILICLMMNDPRHYGDAVVYSGTVKPNERYRLVKTRKTGNPKKWRCVLQKII